MYSTPLQERELCTLAWADGGTTCRIVPCGLLGVEWDVVSKTVVKDGPIESSFFFPAAGWKFSDFLGNVLSLEGMDGGVLFEGLLNFFTSWIS